MFCSLWRNVDTFWHTLRRCFPPSTNSAAYTGDNCQLAGPWSCGVVLAGCSVDTMQWRQIGSESRFLPTPPAFDASVRGGGFPLEYCHAVWYGKTRMAWLSDGEKFLKTCLFVLTECTNVSDTQTDTAWQLRPRCIASRGKNICHNTLR